VVGSGDGLLKPEPLVLADHRTDQQRITPNVPTERTRAWAAKLPSYQDTYSVRSHQYHRAGSLLAGVVLPVLYTAGEAVD
jgi:hypothetical protein